MIVRLEHRHRHGPKVQGTPEELLAIEREVLGPYYPEGTYMTPAHSTSATAAAATATRSERPTTRR